jgi:hypothetical protein
MAEVHGNRTRVDNTGKHEAQPECGAKSGALERVLPLVDPDLKVVIERWPELSDEVRASILAMVRASGK